MDIRYDVQGFVIWHDIKIPCTAQDSVVIPARSSKVFYVKVKNQEVKTGLVPRLDLGEGLYAGDAIVTNRNGRAYIKITNTHDVDKTTIAAPEVELEAIEEIAPQPKISKKPTKDLRIGEVNEIAIDRTPNTRSDAIKDLLRLVHLNKEEADHVDRIIGKYSDLFRLPDEPLGHYSQDFQSLRQTGKYQAIPFSPIHKDEINKQIKDLLENDLIKAFDTPYNTPVWVVPKKPYSKGNKRWRMVIDIRY